MALTVFFCSSFGAPFAERERCEFGFLGLNCLMISVCIIAEQYR